MSGSRTLAAIASALLEAFELGFDADDADDFAVRLIGLGYTVAPIRERSQLREAEDDATEEARQFPGVERAWWLDGARWALARWRLAEPEPAAEAAVKDGEER